MRLYLFLSQYISCSLLDRECFVFVFNFRVLKCVTLLHEAWARWCSCSGQGESAYIDETSKTASHFPVFSLRKSFRLCHKQVTFICFCVIVHCTSVILFFPQMNPCFSIPQTFTAFTRSHLMFSVFGGSCFAPGDTCNQISGNGTHPS